MNCSTVWMLENRDLETKHLPYELVPAYGSPQKATASTGLLPRQCHGLAICVLLSADRARDKVVNSSDSLRTKQQTGVFITPGSSLQYSVSVSAAGKVYVPPPTL